MRWVLVEIHEAAAKLSAIAGRRCEAEQLALALPQAYSAEDLADYAERCKAATTNARFANRLAYEAEAEFAEKHGR